MYKLIREIILKQLLIKQVMLESEIQIIGDIHKSGNVY